MWLDSVISKILFGRHSKINGNDALFPQCLSSGDLKTPYIYSILLLGHTDSV